LLSGGGPDGEMLDRALHIVRSGGSLEHARAAVSAEVARADALARQLPDGTARHALIQLARFLAVRCGADAGSDVA
jgi:geranylgeranyl pyrophosphate synthase